MNSAAAKKDASDAAEKVEKEKKATTQTKAPVTSAVVKADQNVLEEGAIDLPPILLDNELNAGAQQSYPNLGGNDTNGLMARRSYHSVNRSEMHFSRITRRWMNWR